jgi:hypothetical protein
MTDQELKDLVASLAAAQDKFAADNAAGFAALREAQAKTETIVAELTQSIKDTEVRSEREINALTQSIKDTRSEVAGVGNSQGLVAEEYFFNSLADVLKLGSIKFDRIERNRNIKLPAAGQDAKAQKYEYDIMMINGKALAVIETKYKATKEGLTQLQRNIDGVRLAMPEFNKHKIYGGIAAFSINDKLIDEAHKKGYFVLQRKGDSFVTDTQAMKAF